MHSMLGLAGFLGLIAFAFGKRAAAFVAAFICMVSVVFVLMVAVALIWPEGSWLDQLLYGKVDYIRP